jgi:hypothetical protein
MIEVKKEGILLKKTNLGFESQGIMSNKKLNAPKKII